MTFIASVIARDGIALVADSFVTTVEHSIDEGTFLGYLKTIKSKKNVPLLDIIKLFNKRPSHTRNYADKLFPFGKYSAVATTGAAYINGKEIRELVVEIAQKMKVDEAAYLAMPIVTILQNFCDLIKAEITEHLKKHDMGETDFIFSHYNRINGIPQVFKIRIKSTDKAKFDPAAANADMVLPEEQSHLKIITDGQDSFVDRLIFGSLYKNTLSIRQKFVNYIFKEFRLTAVKKKKIKDELLDFDFVRDIVREDVFSIKFRDLSLQEAVDLAALLIRIIMDIQVYTEKIPTVGGLIRLAIIHKETGFDWISGDQIVPSKII